MNRLKIFISGVQKELAEERHAVQSFTSSEESYYEVIDSLPVYSEISPLLKWYNWYINGTVMVQTAQRTHKGLTKGSSSIPPLPERKLQPEVGENSRAKHLMSLEQKIGEFEPESVGKMQFYLAAPDARMREEGENPSIGVILCKEKSRTIVEYAFWDVSRPIGIASYRIFCELTRELEGQITGPDEITRLLEGI